MPKESLPNELLLAISDGASAKAKKEACVSLPRLHGKVFCQHNPVRVAP